MFVLGAKPGVAEVAAQNAHERYGVRVAGVHNGYFDPAEDARVAALVGGSGADLLLTAMGAARQEIFNEYWRGVLNVPVMMGVGGVLDVLAGTASLAPDWTRRLGVEWLWRVAGDRRRWGRAPALAGFVGLSNFNAVIALQQRIDKALRNQSRAASADVGGGNVDVDAVGLPGEFQQPLRAERVQI